MTAVPERRILVIDDEPAIRESMTEFLRDYGYSVECADSGEAALKLAADEDFDVVIVDLRLPGMSGETLLAELHRRANGTSFLIHTGSVDYQLSDELQVIGVEPGHIIHKPQFDLTAVVRKIEEVASGD